MIRILKIIMKCKMLRVAKYIIALAVAVLAVAAAWWVWRAVSGVEEDEHVEVRPVQVVDLRAIAELCTTEIIHETTIVDTINSKVIVGIQRQKGSIRYDVEALPDSLQVAVAGPAPADTLRLRLPAEQVEILEDTGRGAWRVVDSRSLSLFKSGTLTTAEENAVKRKAISATRSRLYADGTVRRSRQEAAATLGRMLTLLTGRPVVVEP